MTEQTIEGEFAEQGLAVVPPKEIALSTQDPSEFLERAVKQADALKRVIDAKKLAVFIGGSTKAHVLIDGWQTLMALNGVMPFTLSCVQTRCVAAECQVLEKCRGGRLTAHVVTEIRRVNDGTVLTRVETECSQHERRWAGADDYAVLSMAQTRGVGKGCRQLFGWVMSLAGYNATPAEEIPEDAPPPRDAAPRSQTQVGEPTDRPRSENRTGYSDQVLRAAGEQSQAPKTGYVDTAPTNDRELRAEAIRLWNEHPKEAVAYIKAGNLPSGVASMDREQVIALREHLKTVAV